MATMFSLLTKLLAFLAPMVCASPDWSGPYVNEAGYCRAPAQSVCKFGKQYAGSQMQVCCPDGQLAPCRYSTADCEATEYNPCDRPWWSDQLACMHWGDTVYLGGPICDPGDPILCMEGNFAGAGDTVCCDYTQAVPTCSLKEACGLGEVAFCATAE